LEIVDERDMIIDMQQYALKRWNERKAKYNFLGNSEKEGLNNIISKISFCDKFMRKTIV
jgi:hypothetical protein